MDHTVGPVNGSLYAQVKKGQQYSLMQNGSGDGRHNSMDSGISSTSGKFTIGLFFKLRKKSEQDAASE